MSTYLYLYCYYIYLSIYLSIYLVTLTKKKVCIFNLQKKSNTSAYQNRCVLRLILYHVCVNLPVIIFSYPAFKFMGLRSSLPLPHWYRFASFLVLLLSPRYILYHAKI